MKEAIDGFTKLSATIFSPFKMLFMGIVLLRYNHIMVFKDENLYKWLCLIIGLEIFHNDFLRIILNRWAEYKCICVAKAIEMAPIKNNEIIETICVIKDSEGNIKTKLCKKEES